MKFFAGALLALSASAQIERDSRITDIANLASPDTDTENKRYENYIKYETDLSTSDTWNIWVKSVYNEDDGEIKLRIMHELEADIPEDDIITFQIAFTSASDPYIDRFNILQKDVAKCELINNTQDTRFWTQQASDGNWKCNDEVCSAPTNSFNTDTSPSDLDWTNPVTDDSPSDPFCTTHSTDATNFACEKIVCIHERAMITGNDDDFQFAVSSSGTDTVTYIDDQMTITAAEAQYGINTLDSSGTAPDAGTATYSVTNADITIEILTGAVSSLAVAGAALATLTMF